MEGNRNKKVIEIYTAAVEVYNTVLELKKLTPKYFSTNWTVGMSNITYDVQHMLYTLEEQDFSLDYKQANTFMSYLKIFEFLLRKMADELVVYDEGMGTMEFIQGNLEEAFKPFGAFICSRIRDLGLLPQVPGVLQKMYHQYEDKIDEYMEVDMSSIFDFAFTDEESLDDDDYLEGVRGQMTGMFGEDVDIKDFTRISQILANYMDSAEQEAAIELDF